MKYTDSPFYFVYIVTCHYKENIFIKIGMSNDIYRRKKEIQVGCPHKIDSLFIIKTEFFEESKGLEEVLHRILPDHIRGEWYEGSYDFFIKFEDCLNWINDPKMSFNELEEIADSVSMEALEIILHHHKFQFHRIPLKFNKSDRLFSIFKPILIKEVLTEIENPL